MSELLFFVAVAAFLATMLGGLFALRLRDKLHVILGFSAGAVIAVAFFDLLPEAMELSGGTHESNLVFGLAAVGFLGYLTLDRALLALGFGHSHDGGVHDDHAHEEPRAPGRGSLRAGSLSIHSFLDGLGIGLAFQVSTSVGLLIAAAVLAHDFSDGINTVNVLLRHGARRVVALRWLLVDAFAPVAGILVSLFLAVPDTTLGLLLSLFAGFFLYIGASDLVPESYHAHPKFLTTAMTLLGALVLYGAITIAG